MSCGVLPQPPWERAVPHPQHVPPPATESGTIPINAGRMPCGNTLAGVAVPRDAGHGLLIGDGRSRQLHRPLRRNVAHAPSRPERTRYYLAAPHTSRTRSSRSVGTDFSPATSRIPSSRHLCQQPTATCGVGQRPAPTSRRNYFHGHVPEYAGTGDANAPYTERSVRRCRGQWRTAMTNWCSTCHSGPTTTLFASRPAAPPTRTPAGDAIYKYRHPTSVECTQCHVAMGPTAQMPGDGPRYQLLGRLHVSGRCGRHCRSHGSSRLLKVDNRGTCQQCHDPTGTISTPATSIRSPVTSPAVAVRAATDSPLRDRRGHMKQPSGSLAVLNRA